MAADLINFESTLSDFLSKDTKRILNASHLILKSVINNREFIEKFYPYLEDIKKSTNNLNYGGMILSNDRFVKKAILVISESISNNCLCSFAFESYGQNAKLLKESYGFEFLSCETKDFKNIGKIKCPICKQKYLITEEYTGWHITSTYYEQID